MKIAFFSFTDRGNELKNRLSAYLPLKGHEIFAIPPELSLKNQAAAAFDGADALLFVGAAGIAVRAVAPFVHSKVTDPAVIVIDELGKWIIPLLGGHIGGGNGLALEVAVFLEAEAIITTATDINKVFAVDVWASKQNLAISSMEKAKKVSANLLKGECVTLKSDYDIAGKPPRGILYGRSSGRETGFGIVVSMRRAETEDGPLYLIPRRVYIGIGCRRGVQSGVIAEILDEEFEVLRLDKRCIAGVGSIDLKKDEAGLLEFCDRLGAPCSFFGADELRLLEGSFIGSSFVRAITGVDNVCERAASALSGGGKLLLKKTARRGVTIAVAVKEMELTF
ncbi:MAG: cobalamin biosynthesis protein [Treponema sp.]|nr:cobalamin biosynthesis protein [Treponema sp.]